MGLSTEKDDELSVNLYVLEAIHKKSASSGLTSEWFEVESGTKDQVESKMERVKNESLAGINYVLRVRKKEGEGSE